MIAKLLYSLSSDLPLRVIHIEGKPYMERHALGKCFGLTFYLHRFVSADGERSVHDHPWARSWSLVLTGGYIEERLIWLCAWVGWDSTHIHRKRWRINRIHGNTFHRITWAQPETWTLFIHTKRCKGWGFLSQDTIEGDKPRPCVIYDQPYDPIQTKGWEKRAPIAALHPDRTIFRG